MIKDQAKRGRVSGFASLLSIHLIKHSIGEVAPGLKEEEPSRDWSKQIKSPHGEHDDNRNDGVNETEKSE